ncbi:MAG TPA: heparan-alpha-glucosaminide N-acetyltransferase domain-containing protein [Opitutus sp.]|nr:heparan-alpha-glucosaminide N-acetyltransferase domain-containing protein [Opitutus sp.]
MSSPAGEAASAAGGHTPPSQRLTSVDALRGFDMAWILGAGPFVQSFARIDRNPATTFLDDQFEHVRWEGFHFYDLIYPLFVFLVGVSIVFSLDRKRGAEPRSVLVGRILRRGALLYLLNFIFNGGFAVHWPHMRVASGVLALIAASYVIAAILYVFLADRLKVLAGVTVALLVGYWALLGLTPFPDFHLDQVTVERLAAQAGSHSPAAIAAMVPERVSGVYEEGRNLSNYVDFRVIPGRMLDVYYENQGVLSPITGAAVCLMGIFAARLLKAAAFDRRRKVHLLALTGVAAVGLGLLWGLEFPIVKKLWSSSYCLIAGGCSALLLAAFYLVVDVWEWRGWCQPFVWIGMNPITLYVLSSLVDFRGIAARLVGGDLQDGLNGLHAGLGLALSALMPLLLVVALARFLHHRKIFLRV